MVGSSITIKGSGCGFSTLVIVSPMVMPSTPATAMMSPMVVSVVSVRFRPLKVKSLVIFVFSSDPSRLEIVTLSPACRVPWKTRQTAMRPK